MSLAPELLEILVCPKCKGELEYRTSPESLVCHACRLVYAVEDDIPTSRAGRAIMYAGTN